MTSALVAGAMTPECFGQEGAGHAPSTENTAPGGKGANDGELDRGAGSEGDGRTSLRNPRDQDESQAQRTHHCKAGGDGDDPGVPEANPEALEHEGETVDCHADSQYRQTP